MVVVSGEPKGSSINNRSYKRHDMCKHKEDIRFTALDPGFDNIQINLFVLVYSCSSRLCIYLDQFLFHLDHTKQYTDKLCDIVLL